MIIKDEEQAVSFLQKNHYYRLNIYFHKLMVTPNCFESKVHFSQIIAVYENDKWLRNNIFSVLETIEINTRTQIAFYLAMKYGSDAFYKEKIFKNKEKYSQIFRNFSTQISRNKKDPVIYHHQKKYEGIFPIWVVIEYFSFNTLSKLYSNLLEVDKKVIAKSFNNANDYLLGQWLHVLSIQRNICAHYGYLFQRDYPIRPIIAKSFCWDKKRNDKLFAQFLVMRRLSDKKTWEDFIQIISANENKRHFLSYKDYGFPNNWKSYLL